MKDFFCLSLNSIVFWILVTQLNIAQGEVLQENAAFLGQKIYLGQKKYGKKKIKPLQNVDKSAKDKLINFKRQALHAYFLSFIHPIKKNKIELNSKLPNDINALIEQLKLI